MDERMKVDRYIREYGELRRHFASQEDTIRQDERFEAHVEDNLQDMKRIINISEYIMKQVNGHAPGMPILQLYTALASFFIQDPNITENYCQGAVKAIMKVMLAYKLEKLRRRYEDESDL